MGVMGRRVVLARESPGGVERLVVSFEWAFGGRGSTDELLAAAAEVGFVPERDHWTLPATEISGAGGVSAPEFDAFWADSSSS